MPVKKDVGNLPSGKRTSREQESGWIDRARKKRSVECRFMWQLCEKLKTLALHDQTKESPKRLNFSLTCSLSPSSCWFFFPNFRTSQFVAVLLFSECTQKVFSWDKSTFFPYHSLFSFVFSENALFSAISVTYVYAQLQIAYTLTESQVIYASICLPSIYIASGRIISTTAPLTQFIYTRNFPRFGGCVRYGGLIHLQNIDFE